MVPKENTMKARYHGTCGHCYGRIKPGEEIGRLWPGQPFMHIVCLEKIRTENKEKELKECRGCDEGTCYPDTCCGA